MQHSSDQTNCFKLLDFLGNEMLSLQGLFPNLLFDGSGMRADSKVVLNYLPMNTEDVRWLLGKHIDILPQEGNERAFLFVSKGSTDGEGTTSAILPCWDFLCLRIGDPGLLASGTLW